MGTWPHLRRLADQNAEVQLTDSSESSPAVSNNGGSADEAATLLGVPRLDHVVCFDMAQLQGEARVGASVVLRHGRPLKREYRTYRVKDGAMDDLRMMREVVERWLKRRRSGLIHPDRRRGDASDHDREPAR